MKKPSNNSFITSALFAALCSFFIIGIIRLFTIPFTLFLLLLLQPSISQPLAGIIAATVIMIILIIPIIYIQKKYERQFSKEQIYGVWAGWAIQVALTFLSFLVY